MDQFVLISGCSGGGKSTLLDELSRRGHCVIEEPGRRVVKDEVERNGSALPWVDAAAFLRRAINMALTNWALATNNKGWTFFDRGLIDAASGLQHLTGEPLLEKYGQSHRYNDHVFLTPPWPEIYVHDSERRHDLDLAIIEYDRLFEAYTSLGYEISVLPKIGVTERADLVLNQLAAKLSMSV